MARSAVLTGRLSQRDRAHLRGRLDARPAPAPTEHDADEALAAWLRSADFGESLDALEALDVTDFVRATAHVAHGPAERLRQLAVWLEARLVASAPQPRAWLAHDRLYAAALALDPRDASTHHSRAVSARAHADALWRPGLTRDDWIALPLRRRMMKRAHASAAQALALEPDSADMLRRVAALAYDDPDRGPAEALALYDRALELEPRLNPALLYRAHCLHDLARWREAALAYDAVDPGYFTGRRAWRYEHLLEQRAHCWLHAGERERALREFEALLTRWERNPHLAAEAWGRELTAAARGLLRDELWERTLRLCEREERSRSEESKVHPFGGLWLPELREPR